jgi:signal transduction histidine kinase
MSLGQSYSKSEAVQQLLVAKDFNSAYELLVNIDPVNFNDKEKAYLRFDFAKVYLALDKHELAYSNALQAKSIFTSINDLESLFDTNKLLLDVLGVLQKPTTAKQAIVEENCSIANLLNDVEKKIYCYGKKALIEIDQKNFQEAVLLFQSIDQLARRENKKDLIIKNLSNIGVAHYLNGNYDSTFHYYKRKEELLKENNDIDELAYLYNNYGQLYNQIEDYPNAINYFNKALELELTKESKSTRLIFLKNIATSYANNGDFEASTENYSELNKLRDELEPNQLMSVIQELETKYQTAEKEKNLLLSETKSQKRLSTIYLITAAAIALLLLSGLLYNNQRKKKLLAQKERELEKQRADAVLKNQELATIDAMISGQEKERKKLAEELHDHLGSSLTTVKLYFDNLKTNVKDKQGLEVYYRTEKILDDTYETIRSMSHTRNNGVLASKGLIPSVESLAHKITSSGKLQVNVIHHGLDKKLESSLELIIFRTVQELLSNVVKHAKATECIVNLTSYEDNLNIMVEDNGIGFNATHLPENDGMGLHSIEKRIENLEGSFEIDSHLGRGTTINIDIPYYDQPNYS